MKPQPFFIRVGVLLLLVAGIALGASEKAKLKKKQTSTDPLAGRPYIAAMYPAGGQRGKTVEIVLSGTNLATEVPESERPQPTPTPTPQSTPAPTAKPAPSAVPATSGTASCAKPPPAKPAATPGAPAVKPTPADLWKSGTVRISGHGVSARVVGDADPKSLRLSITVAPEAEPGERDVRVITRDGISNRYRFFVGELPEINEVEPNNDNAHAQVLPPLPVLVNGRVDQNDSDVFRFHAKAGEAIVCLVQARAILPYIADAVPGWFDPVLTLEDSKRRVLQTVNGFRFKIDPILIFKVPKDGDYLLGIRDVLYRGRVDFVYRMAIGQLPFITHVFPLGGQRGSTVDLELRGVNLPEPARKFEITNDPDSRRTLTVQSHGFTSNAIALAAGDLPEIREVEPNDTLATAQRVPVPVVINGRIGKPGDSDWFIFHAKAKQRLVLEVTARRLDSPLDSILTLTGTNTAKGNEIAENDDTVDLWEPLMTHHADSRLVQTFETEGDYAVRLRDVEQKGGDEYAYRLTIAPPQRDFALRVTPANAVAGQGDTAVINVAAIRRDGFKGDVALSVEGLPAGSVVSGSVIPSGQDETAITITVPPNAALGVSTPTIVGTGTAGEKTLVRRALPAEPVMQAFATIHPVFAKEFLLGIADAPPFSLRPVTPAGTALEVKQGGEVQVVVKAIRKPGVTGGITLGAQKPGTGFSVRTPFIALDKDETTVTISAFKGAPVGTTQSIILSGTLKAGKPGVSVAPAITVKVLPEE